MEERLKEHRMRHHDALFGCKLISPVESTHGLEVLSSLA